jgi:Mrp family chromosome partitioning ATPase/capsular polysaccharide biosynthesis protein
MEPLPYQSTAALGASRAMRRYWRMIVGLVLVFGVGGYFYAARGPGSYGASATILVRALVGNAYSVETSTTQAATVALETEAQLVGSSQVTDLVRRTLPGTTCNQDSVTAKVLTNTQLIKISASAATADTARRCAQQYATDYLARRQELAVAAQTSQLASLNAQLTAAEKTLASATAVANGPKPPSGAAARVEAESALLAATQSQIGQLSALSTQPGNVVVAASSSPTASSFSPALAALAGAGGGLLLGVLLAIARERRRQRRLTEAQVDVLDLPMLAELDAAEASVASGGTSARPRLPEPAEDEEFRQATVKLLAHAVPKSLIAVTSLSVADATAVPTLRLAGALAAAGYRIAVVEAVTRNPQVAALLGITARAGLSDILTTPGDRTPPSVAVTVAGLTVIAAGEEPAKSGPYFPGPRMSELLAELKDVHDFVLMATGVMDTADGLGPLLAADEAVLVVRDAVAGQADVEQAQAMIERLGAHLLGLIVMRGRVRPAGHRSAPTPVPEVPPSTVAQPPPTTPSRASHGVPGSRSEDLDPAGRTPPGWGRS